MRAVLLGLLLVMSACGPEEEKPLPPTGLNGATTHLCTGFMEWTPGSGTGFGVTHFVWSFPDGSAMTTCVVDGGRDSASVTVLYRSKDPGAKPGSCSVVYDVDGYATAGEFTFAISLDRKASTVTYIDEDTPGGKRTIQATCVQR